MTERDRAAVDVDLAPRRCRASASSCSVTEANASLISHRSISSARQPGLLEGLAGRLGGGARQVGEVVGDLRLGDDRRERRSCRCACAHSSLASTSAPPPSLTPGRVPGGVRAVLADRSPGSFASVSSVVSRRGASSTSTTVSPLRPLIVTGTISSARRPSSVASIASWCERSAQRSMSARVSSELGGDLARLARPCGLPANGFVQPVVDHRVDRLAVAHPVAEAGLLEQVGRVRHRLHAAADADLDVAGADRRVEQPDGAHPRGAHLVDRLRGDLLRDPGLDLRLAGRDLALAGLEHLAHDDVLDLLGRDLGALERGLDRGAAELGRVDASPARRRACRSACGRPRE